MGVLKLLGASEDSKAGDEERLKSRSSRAFPFPSKRVAEASLSASADALLDALDDDASDRASLCVPFFFVLISTRSSGSSWLSLDFRACRLCDLVEDWELAAEPFPREKKVCKVVCPDAFLGILALASASVGDDDGSSKEVVLPCFGRGASNDEARVNVRLGTAVFYSHYQWAFALENSHVGFRLISSL